MSDLIEKWTVKKELQLNFLLENYTARMAPLVLQRYNQLFSAFSRPLNSEKSLSTLFCRLKKEKAAVLEALRRNEIACCLDELLDKIAGTCENPGNASQGGSGDVEENCDCGVVLARKRWKPDNPPTHGTFNTFFQ